MIEAQSTTSHTIALDDQFARELPELAMPWQGLEAPQPRLIVLNEPVAADLGLDPAWLRTDDGLGLLTGTRGATPGAARPTPQGSREPRRL